MSVLHDTWRYLIQRRLWPVALPLVGAIVAVPVVLAKDPEPAAAPPAAAAKADSSRLAAEPVVALAGPGDRAERRRVLGARKNPFKPAVMPTPTATPAAATASTSTPATTPAGGGTSTPGGTSSPGGSASPTSPAITLPGGVGLDPATPFTPKKRYELYELAVRFGASSGELERRNLKRLEALPSSEEPILVYLGVMDDRKTAVFLLDKGTLAQGDGSCQPSRSSCETIHLKEGETEFFDVLGEDGTTVAAQYQLDLVKIHRRTSTSAKAAKAARARVSKAGQKILRARVRGDGPLPLAFSAKTGRLHKLSRKAFKAAVARAAKAARAHS